MSTEIISLVLPPAKFNFMNRFSLSFALVFGVFTQCLLAQNALLAPVSPRSNGLGKTSLNFTDLHSLLGNQAGLAEVETFGLLSAIDQRFLLGDLNQAAFGAALPTFSGVFGLTLRSFGTADYREIGAGLVYARKLSEYLRIGGQLHWAQLGISEYGSRSLFNLDIGLQAELLPKLWAGAQVRNAIRQQVLDGEYTPMAFSAGLAYTVADKIVVFTELYKDIDFPADVRIGIEYNPSKTVYLRGGMNTSPGGWSFGFGLPVFQNLAFDCAVAYHPYLGFTPSAGLAYRKKK